jgi:hypothetical protein
VSSVWSSGWDARFSNDGCVAPKNLPIDQAVSDEIKAELAAEDQQWLPRIATSISTYPLAGAHRILVKSTTSSPMSMPS